MPIVHQPRCLLVTGGAGFIGTNFVRLMLARRPGVSIINVDALTYAGGLGNLSGLGEEYPGRYRFFKTDIRDRQALAAIFQECRPDTVVHFAAESHVDRSIDRPMDFVDTNVTGTAALLEAARAAWAGRGDVRFHHISTDEVFGSLGPEGLFRESTPYDPSSPYSASKAAADHLVRAWQRTYGLPTSLTNCSNNYGPWQFPEKLIPLMITKALAGESLPIYGTGKNIRDWLHVEDHVDAIWEVLTRGEPGCTYAVGGGNEWSNLDLVSLLCTRLDALCPMAQGSYGDRITFVLDRPGHDARYAVDCTKIEKELGWRPRYTFASGLDQTIQWYLAHQDWVKDILAHKYNGARLGNTGDAVGE